jgi:Glycyl-tRNA synthetase, beta subunit
MGEDIPSSSQTLVQNQFQELFKSLLDDSDISYKDIITFSTSRRVTICVTNLSKSTKTKTIEIRGPQINANEKAIKGFLKSNNLNNIELLSKKEINKKVYYFHKKSSEAKRVVDLLKFEVPKILRSIKWNKSMRWGEHSDRWIRPIKNILCIFDKKVVKFEFAGHISNQFTYGNYHYSEKKIKCLDYINYKKKLNENYVILERSLRQNAILNKIKSFCKKNKLSHFVSQSLLKRTSDLVEFPTVFFGKFSSDFFKLPEFLLINIMTDKQDYFFFKDQKNKLSDRFGFVSGINQSIKRI